MSYNHIKDRCFEVQIKVYGNKCNLDCFMCHPILQKE